MSETDEYKLSFQFLEKPVRISEQRWDADVQPFVSISCITFNHEKYIRDAFEGFLMQETTFPVEILVHDDASTDSTADIIREYEARYPSLFRVIYQNENQYSKKVKIGFTYQYTRVRGKYYATCEGDDYWIDPLKLQKQVEFLEKNPEYSLCFHSALVDDSGVKVPKYSHLEEREYSGEEILKRWTIPTASVLFRVANLDFSKMNNKNYLFSDIVLFLTLAEEGRIWCINENMCVYRRHSGGVSYFTNSNVSTLKKFISHHEEISKNFGGKYVKTENKILSKYYVLLGFKQIKKGDLGAINSFYKAIKKSKLDFLINIATVLSEKNQSIKR